MAIDYSSFGKALLKAGANPKAAEGCGSTPLTLAVLSKNKTWLTSFCSTTLHFKLSFTPNIPTPGEMAELMGLENIILLFDNTEESENKVINNMIWEEISPI